MSMRPEAFQSRYISRSSSGDQARAFSQKTCLPASKAASVMGTCMLSGVQIITPSIWLSSRSAR